MSPMSYIKGYSPINFLYFITRINRKVKNKGLYSFIIKKLKHLFRKPFTGNWYDKICAA